MSADVGTRPEHIKALAERIAKIKAEPAHAEKEAMLASPVQAVEIEQKPAPFIIGERMNAQGSKAFKRLLLAEDYEAIMQVARDQLAFGAHGLDISVATTERSDEAELMRAIVKKLSLEVPVPLIIDTTEVAVAEGYKLPRSEFDTQQILNPDEKGQDVYWHAIQCGSDVFDNR